MPFSLSGVASPKNWRFVFNKERGELEGIGWESEFRAQSSISRAPRATTTPEWLPRYPTAPGKQLFYDSGALLQRCKSPHVTAQDWASAIGLGCQIRNTC